MSLSAHERIAARRHGKRLADEGRKLTPDLVGQLAWHEGADFKTEAFSAELTAAYDAAYVPPVLRGAP